MVSYALTGHGQQHQEENVARGVADELYEGVLDVLSCNNSVISSPVWQSGCDVNKYSRTCWNRLLALHELRICAKQAFKVDVKLGHLSANIIHDYDFCEKRF